MEINDFFKAMKCELPRGQQALLNSFVSDFDKMDKKARQVAIICSVAVATHGLSDEKFNEYFDELKKVLHLLERGTLSNGK